MRNLAAGILRWFRGDGEGTLYYLDANEEETPLPIPSDWEAQDAAGTPYTLGIIAGLPAWRITAASAIDGFGSGFGDAFGQD